MRAFGHPVTTCCDMLGVTNRTSVHGLAQCCCTNVARRLQHHATSTKVAWKIGPFSNLILQHPTCRSTQTIATFRRNIPVGAIAIAKPELQWVARSHLASTGRTKKLCLCLCSPHDRVVVPYWWVYSASCLQASINTLNFKASGRSLRLFTLKTSYFRKQDPERKLQSSSFTVDVLFTH